MKSLDSVIEVFFRGLERARNWLLDQRESDAGPRVVFLTLDETEISMRAALVLFAGCFLAALAASPGVCSNNHTVACATSANCGGATCFLPTRGGSTLRSQPCLQDASAIRIDHCDNKDIAATAAGVRVTKQCAFPGDYAVVSFVAALTQGTDKPANDVGLWIAEDGGNGMTGRCTVASVPSAPTPMWFDLDGDSCGDIGAKTTAFFSIENVNVTCVDKDADGFADITVCMTSGTQTTRFSRGDARRRGPLPPNVVCNGPMDTWSKKCGCVKLSGIVLPMATTFITSPTLISTNVRVQGNMHVAGELRIVPGGSLTVTNTLFIADGGRLIATYGTPAVQCGLFGTFAASGKRDTVATSVEVVFSTPPQEVSCFRVECAGTGLLRSSLLRRRL
jgi:hypothetical protein